jgi:N-acetyl-gamma-glutamyl-phosphate reductase
MSKTRVGIVGARSYTARELLGCLIRHPAAEAVCLMARVEAPANLGAIHPPLRGRIDCPVIPIDLELLMRETDLVFLCLPHGPAAEMARPLIEAEKRVVDLSADFRFRRPELYAQAYGQAHPAPELLDEAVYGLPELWRDEIRGARIVGNPGCYPTSVLLALAPLVRAYPNEVPAAGVIANCASGISGAGRTLSERAQFCEANEGYQPYGLVTHRHAPEIDAQIAAFAGRPLHVTFAPHLAPMDRGICSTVHIPWHGDLPPLGEVRGAFERICEAEPLLRLMPEGEYVNTKAVAHTNLCDIAVTADPRANLLIVMTAIDNLLKGASGQAIQNMNLMIGCEETTALL